MDTIRDKGVTTVSIERDVKERMRELAGGKDIYVFVREMVDEYAERHPQAPLGLGSPGNVLTKPLEGKIDSMIDSVSVMMWTLTLLLFSDKTQGADYHNLLLDIQKLAGKEFIDSLKDNLGSLMPKGEQKMFEFEERLIAER